MGYHPDSTGVLTGRHESGDWTLLGGQFDWGGRLLKSNGGAQRFPQNGRKSLGECKGRREPDCETNKSNRLISPKSPHRRGGLAPRCRLVASWGCSRSQGLGCSPIKAARELGSERRETVRSLSVAGVGNLRGSAPSTRGPEWTYRWCTSCSAKSIAG